jgi:hypothetical protein
MSAPWQRSWLKSKNNPLLFVTDVLGAMPEPWQAEALKAVGQHDRVSIRSGHGVGKTTLEAWLRLGNAPGSRARTIRSCSSLMFSARPQNPGRQRLSKR